MKKDLKAEWWAKDIDRLDHYLTSLNTMHGEFSKELIKKTITLYWNKW